MRSEGGNPNTRRVFPSPGRDLRAWRVYYDQGRIYESTNHSWEDLPEWGVQFVLLWYGSGGPEVVMGEDEYVLAGEAGEASVKYGVQLSDSEFWTLHEAALYDFEPPGRGPAT